jgi:hypothetical protein
MNRADVGMVQGRRRLCLSLKTRQRLWVFRHIVGQEFQRNESTQPCVLCLVDHTHAATAEFFEDAVVGEGPADQRVGAWHLLRILGWGKG